MCHLPYMDMVAHGLLSPNYRSICHQAGPMVINLNTATKAELKAAGLTNGETDRTLKFRHDNAVFHDTGEWKRVCGIPGYRYETMKESFVAYITEEVLQKYPTVSRRTYRRRNDIADSRIHVCHIIAEANGGANCSANYVPMDGRYNQKLQNLHDGIMFLHVSDEQVRQAICASRMGGYRGTYDQAQQMKEAALSNYRELDLYVQGLGRVYGGGFDETDGSSIESQLCDPVYCERLIREWEEKFPATYL